MSTFSGPAKPPVVCYMIKQERAWGIFSLCNEIGSLYDKIIITIVQSCTRKYHSFVAVGIVTHAAHALVTIQMATNS